eukprot:gene4287-7623_t
MKNILHLVALLALLFTIVLCQTSVNARGRVSGAGVSVRRGRRSSITDETTLSEDVKARGRVSRAGVSMRRGRRNSITGETLETTESIGTLEQRIQTLEQKATQLENKALELENEE